MKSAIVVVGRAAHAAAKQAAVLGKGYVPHHSWHARPNCEQADKDNQGRTL